MLRELIRDCGTKFVGLHRSCEDYWEATSTYSNIFEGGTSPEEAVDKLRKTLIKKKLI